MNSYKANILLSHSGKQHAYHVAKAMDDLGYLKKFYTSSYIKNKKLQQFLLKNNNQYWTRRFIKNLYGSKIDANWRFELKEIIYRKIYGKNQKTQIAVYNRDQAFDKYVSKEIKTTEANVFWGFQGSCYESLKTANVMNKISVCELATAHISAAKEILGEEVELHTEWADSIDNFVFPDGYEQRLKEEPHRADFVIAASEFTKQSLLNDGIDEKKIIYLPLGFDNSAIPYYPKQYKNNAKVKLLYAGTITQRKGIKYLLEAIKILNDKNIELHIIGGIQGSGKALQKYQNHFVYHSPVSQKEIFKAYNDYDILVLPTIFEGFGLVIVEAMAAGVPVITTNHSIGAEIINDKENGYIVPIRDAEAIAKAIANFKLLKPDEKQKMSENAYQSVLKYSWKQYAINLETVIKNYFE